MEAVKQRGRTVIVEDPKAARFAGMPEAAVATGGPWTSCSTWRRSPGPSAAS
ncbi:chemotaxis protein CheB [Streptomyces sp. NPDC054866]